MLDDTLVEAYLNRIGVARPKRLDAEALRLLHAQHELTVPFETIDYHLGKEIFIDERVVEKIVYQNRGGGCGEIRMRSTTCWRRWASTSRCTRAGSGSVTSSRRRTTTG